MAIPVFKDANDNYKQVQSAECVEDTDEDAEKNCIVKTMECIDDFGNELEDNPCERRRCNKWEINGDDLTEKPASQGILYIQIHTYYVLPLCGFDLIDSPFTQYLEHGSLLW